MRLGGRQNKNDIRRRFLQGLKQCIERSYGKHMHLIDNVDFVFSFGRTVLHLLADLADVVDAVVGSRIDLNHVHGIARRNRPACRTFPARTPVHRMLTVDRLRKNLGNRRLSRSSGSAK